MRSLDWAAGRLLVPVVRRESLDLAVLTSRAPRGAGISSAGLVHALVGPDAEPACLSLRAALA